jgi:hypothetical protein
MEASLSPQAKSVAEAEAVTTLEGIEKASFGVKAMLAWAAAWSPNPKNPHYFLDLPMKNGQVRPEVVAEWAANAPLTMVHQYVPSLKKYKAIAVDAGDKDKGIAQTVQVLDRILSDYGIQHASEIYEGDHVNRIAARLETKVMPFFSNNLSFKATKR